MEENESELVSHVSLGVTWYSELRWPLNWIVDVDSAIGPRLLGCAFRELLGCKAWPGQDGWAIEPSSFGGSAAQGSESQRYASQAAEEGFLFEIVYREAGVMPARGTPSWLDHGVVTPRSAYVSAKKLVGMADAICWRGPLSITVSPYWLRECVCEGAADGAEHYFYFYETLFSKLGITLPFTAFEQSVLCALNIAPTQLNPNSWAFELLSEDLGWEPSLGVFSGSSLPAEWRR
ncbi:hypothetical protein CR513_32723, partial [Mucuna pruriens]